MFTFQRTPNDGTLGAICERTLELIYSVCELKHLELKQLMKNERKKERKKGDLVEEGKQSDKHSIVN